MIYVTIIDGHMTIFQIKFAADKLNVLDSGYLFFLLFYFAWTVVVFVVSVT
jgi:hypothetical protein